MAPTTNYWSSSSAVVYAPFEMLLRPYSSDLDLPPFLLLPPSPPAYHHFQFLPEAVVKLDDLLGSSPPLSDPLAAPAPDDAKTKLIAAAGDRITIAAHRPPPLPILTMVRPSATAVGAPKQRTSVYRGVTRHRWTGRYEAHLWDNTCRREGQKRKGRQVYLGGYDKEEKAARAYDLAALKYWGSNAAINFPAEHYSKEIKEMEGTSKQELIASLRRQSSGFSRGASNYRGVTRHHQHGRWQARIGRVAGNKDLYLGTFTTEEEAAEAYDVAAIKFRGANAVTNFELSRYNLEAITTTDLPIGASARRLQQQSAQESCDQSAHHNSMRIPGLPSTVPPSIFRNLLQLNTTGTSDCASFYICGEANNTHAVSHSFCWPADEYQQMGSGVVQLTQTL